MGTGGQMEVGDKWKYGAKVGAERRRYRTAWVRKKGAGVDLLMVEVRDGSGFV